MSSRHHFASRLFPILALVSIISVTSTVSAKPESSSSDYQYKETRDLVQLVNDAGDLLRVKGEAAFTDFRGPGSRWRQGETYIFVLDSNGKTLVHPDPAMEGKDEIDRKDINGKPIIRGLIDAYQRDRGY